MSRRSEWGATLRDLGNQLRLMHQTPIGTKGLGISEFDRELWRIGGEWLAANHGTPSPGVAGQDPDVYIASSVHRDGGHTALIGDVVRALSAAPAESPAPRLIVTNASGELTTALDEDAQVRTGITAGNTTVLRGPSLIDRLDQLFERLVDLKPGRLFLFHHPDDPLPVAAARPEIAGQRVLVHHADARLSFGLHLPGMQLIDLNPMAAATTRLQGLAPALLRLTSPDPGPRPTGFLRRGWLVSATSGALAKVSAPHFYSYADTVGVILRTTGGWHVHIGTLDPPALRAIDGALRRSAVPADRFTYVPWAPSVAHALWDYGCDVYFSSFPIDGARTNVEVMASGTPHLRYSARPDAISEIGAAGGLSWHTWEDLEATLRGLADHGELEQRSRVIRAAYESRHHPHVFETCLRLILSGQGGADDPHKEERDLRATRSLANASATTLLGLAQPADGNSTRARVARWLSEL